MAHEERVFGQKLFYPEESASIPLEKQDPHRGYGNEGPYVL